MSKCDWVGSVFGLLYSLLVGVVFIAVAVVVYPVILDLLVEGVKSVYKYETEGFLLLEFNEILMWVSAGFSAFAGIIASVGMFSVESVIIKSQR